MKGIDEWLDKNIKNMKLGKIEDTRPGKNGKWRWGLIPKDKKGYTED